MTIAEWVKSASNRLVAHHAECGDPLQHARLIATETLALSAAHLVARDDQKLHDSDFQRLEGFLERRLSGEPFQYIVGYEDFWKSRFKVGPGVFIPRKETEHLVEEVLKLDDMKRFLTIAELGPGSGNIGVSVLLEKPHWCWIAHEKNVETLPFLKENVRRILGESSNYHVSEGDFFEGTKAGAYDAIVSNPPYIPLMEKLSREVTSEPALALYGGERGWEVLKRLILFARVNLKDRGVFLSEISSTQEAIAGDLLLKNGFENVQIIRDYQGLPRIAKGVKSGSAPH